MFNKYLGEIYLTKILSYFDKDFSTIMLHSRNYFTATVALKISVIITIPLYTRLMSLEEYGIISLFHSYLGIIIILFPLNLYSSVGRYFYENKPDFDEFLGSTLLISFLFFLCSAIILLSWNSNYISFRKQGSYITYLLLFIAPIKIISSIYYQILIPEKKSQLYAKLQIVEGYLNIFISIAFVIYLPNNKFYGPIYGLLISSFIIVIFIISKLIKRVRISFNLAHYKYIILFSLPQLPYALGGVILEQFGRIILGNSNKISDLGIYSLGLQISVIYTYLTTSIRTAFVPDFYKLIQTSNYNRISLIFQKILIISILAAYFVIVFAKEIIHILAHQSFYESYRIVPLIVIGYVFFDMFYVYSPYLEFKKHTWLLSIIVLGSGIVNIFLNYFLIEKIGLIGAGYSFALSYLFMFITTWSILKVFYRLVIPKITIFMKLIAILLLFLVISQLVDLLVLKTTLNLGLRILAFVSFVIIVYYFNIRKILNN